MASVFDLSEFKKYRGAWDARIKELTERGGYYDGSVYQRTRDYFWFLGGTANGNIKPLFLPFSRAVDVDAGIIPAGWEFPEWDGKYEAWSKARDALFDVSKWDSNGILFVHYGAVYGMSGIRVSDYNGRVMITPADPTKFMLAYSSRYDDYPSLAFWIDTYKDDDGKNYEYAEVITPQTISTFKNGELYQYTDADAVQANTFGLIPIVECVHINDGTQFGECTYQKAIVLLNETNDMATRLLSVIKKHEKPQTIITGADPAELERGDDTAWFLPSGSSANFAVPNINIDGVLNFIREIKQGVHDALPELSFDEIKKASQIATQTIELQLMELVLKIKRTRPNYDRAIVEAMKMAGEAAKRLGISEISPLADPELILDADREILPTNQHDAIALEVSKIELANMQRGTNEGTHV